jgi:hypothetical protein
MGEGILERLECVGCLVQSPSIEHWQSIHHIWSMKELLVSFRIRWEELHELKSFYLACFVSHALNQIVLQLRLGITTAKLLAIGYC